MATSLRKAKTTQMLTALGRTNSQVVCFGTNDCVDSGRMRIPVHTRTHTRGTSGSGRESTCERENNYNTRGKMQESKKAHKYTTTRTHEGTSSQSHTRENCAHEVSDYIDQSSLTKMSQKIVKKFDCEYFAFTDGSCWNFDPLRFFCGGSAYVLVNNHAQVVKSMHKGFTKTTSNRMEMLAIISAIASVPEGSSIIVFTDSKYCINAFSEGYPAAKNKDLIALFGKYRKKLGKVLLCHVKGHVGIPLNEWCDYWSNFEYKSMYKKCKEFASKTNRL